MPPLPSFHSFSPQPDLVGDISTVVSPTQGGLLYRRSSSCYLYLFFHEKGSLSILSRTTKESVSTPTLYNKLRIACSQMMSECHFQGLGMLLLLLRAVLLVPPSSVVKPPRWSTLSFLHNTRKLSIFRGPRRIVEASRLQYGFPRFSPPSPEISHNFSCRAQDVRYARDQQLPNV